MPAQLMELAFISVAALLVVVVAVTSLHHLVRDAIAKAHDSSEREVRKRFLLELSEDEPDLLSLSFSDADLQAAENVAWSMLPKVRGSARESLVGWLESTGAVRKAMEMTKSRRAHRRALGAFRLGKAAIAGHAEAIAPLLEDSKPDVRNAAAQALGKTGEPAAVFPLLAVLERRAVATNLVLMALVHVGTPAIPELTKSLASRSASVRRICAQLLGLHGDMASARWLSQLVAYDPDIDVRITSIESLARIGHPRSVEPIERAMAATQPEPVRAAAARALGSMGALSSADSLQLALFDPSEIVGMAAAEALGRLDAKGRGVLELAVATSGSGASRAQQWLDHLDLQAQSPHRVGRRR